MSLKRNVIANYLGQGWTAVMGFAFVPLYISYLGIESYGLIGIFALLQAWLTLLDMGMTPTLSREMARFTGGAHDAQFIRDLLRSVEIIGIGIAVVIALGIWAASGWLACDWLRAEKLPVNAVAQAFAVMGTVAALRFVENIYRSSIVGLQRQVLLNVCTSVMATLRGLGAVAVLVWVSATLEAFFVWQGLVSMATVALFSAIVYRTVPAASQRGRFSVAVLKGAWKFGAGMIGITFLALLLTQVDKVLLTKLLTLEDFGYYTLAAVVANALYMLANPITQAFYPRFTELIARGEQQQLIEGYHKGAQLVTVLMGSAALVLIAFGDRVLTAWTGEASLSRHVAPLVAVLALGTLLNGFMQIPYQIQLAHGWTSLAIKVNLVSGAFIVPAILWVTPIYGAIGAAWVWVALNAGYVLVGIHFMYRRLLPKEKWAWYLGDIGRPLIAATGAALLLRWVMPDETNTLVGAMWLVLVFFALLVVATISSPALREQFIRQVPNKFKLRHIRAFLGR